MVCVPAASSVAVTVVVPPENTTGSVEKLAPPKLSDSVADNVYPVTTLFHESSTVIVTLVVCPAEKLLGSADTSSLLGAAGVTEIELLVPAIVAVESRATIDCDPAASSVAVTVALPLLNDTPPKLAPPRLSESVTESLKLVTTSFDESSAVMVMLVVLPAERPVGAAETINWAAAACVAGETEIELLVPEIVADESVAVIVCVPAVLSVAVTVAIPPVNVTAPNEVPPRLSESVTESLKLVSTLFPASSAVMVTLVVPPEDRLVGVTVSTSCAAIPSV